MWNLDCSVVFPLHCALAVAVLSAVPSGDSGDRYPLAARDAGPAVAAPGGFTYLKKNTRGYKEYLHDKTGIVFVRLPAGSFWMGSPKSEEGSRNSERPRHRVKLASFLIARCEVNQKEWKRAMGTDPSHFKGAKLPVEMVSWEDCQEFCRKSGLSLPTEAQWEYACRAGTDTPFAFGETITTDEVNYGIAPSREPPRGTYRKRTVVVDSLPVNPFGLHHMHGNVEEWCEDVWDPKFYGKAAATKRDPVCRSGRNLRTVRGGSWFHDASICRSAFRGPHVPTARFQVLGFRPVAALR